jgi:hypothetical protein
VLTTVQGVAQWESQEQVQNFFQRIMKETRGQLEQSEAAAEENIEELATLCRTELLDLLQRIVANRKNTSQSLQAIITAKIALLQETTSVLRAEIRDQIEKSGPNERWKEADMTNSFVQSFFNGFNRIRKSASRAKGLVSRSRRPSLMGRRQSSDQTSGSSTPSSAPSSRVPLMSDLHRPKTPTPSTNHSTEAQSAQQFLPPIAEPNQATAIGEMLTSRAEEFVIGRSFTLESPAEEPELSSPVAEVGPDLDYQDICSSSAKLSAYIATNVVDPFLQNMRTKMTYLADARLHNMEKVYERTILGVMAEYEEAIKKEEDQRKRTPEDQRVRSTLAQLQLWANVTAAVSAIEALTKARNNSRQELTDLGSPVSSP